MRQIICIALIFTILPITVKSWDETKLDTVEVRLANGELKEQYQVNYWGGTETTYKYGFYRSFYKNGQKKWEGQYGGGLGNLKIGTWIKWDSSGFRLEEISYVNGLKNGAEIEWNSDGTYRKLIYYKNDSLHGLCTWSKPGEIINEVFNNPDLAIDSQSFYLDGKLIVNFWNKHTPSSYHPVEGPPLPNYNSEVDLWYETKKLGPGYSAINRNATFHFGHKTDGKKHGLWIAWDKSGNMEKIELYDNGTLIKSE